MWSKNADLGGTGFFEGYGLGWFVPELDGHRFAWHLGSNPGYLTSMILAPDDGVAVVTADNLLPNTEAPPWYAADVGNAIMLMLLGIDESVLE